jgi:hypothetical protein
MFIQQTLHSLQSLMKGLTCTTRCLVEKHANTIACYKSGVRLFFNNAKATVHWSPTRDPQPHFARIADVCHQVLHGFNNLLSYGSMTSYNYRAFNTVPYANGCVKNSWNLYVYMMREHTGHQLHAYCYGTANLTHVTWASLAHISTSELNRLNRATVLAQFFPIHFLIPAIITTIV